ncbi:right-handed parallel beta-helix repeat-containing protein [Halococcoides cellulosivorans]|uniref:Right handed beta helix domain-containing protein n=1 Tax=Halococcoides cellulosivorans TaxID=1679096 RepID=A0A2R4X341_9EURY|nr:right-handed parallel beta-helix repeat-containing protein [Halococcoides cellulosivorans]AWB28202.1 hypothetical protein HARCEL1_11050 [Halococcoides cellulosivorans]
MVHEGTHQTDGAPTGRTRREALGTIAAAAGGLVGVAGTASAAPVATVTGSGGSYETTSGGSTVHTGGDLAEAIRAGIDALPDGRSSREEVLVEASGDISEQIFVPSYTDLNLQGSYYASGIIPFYADQVESITIRNLTLEGDVSMGMRIRRADDVVVDGITMEISSGIGIRIDDAYNDATPERTTDVRIGTVEISGAGHHSVETYGVTGFTADTVRTWDSGGCGLLLNNTDDAEVGLVDATRANEGGGYAGFRCANDAGPNIHVERVEAVDCGRGIFTVSNSGGITIDEVYLEGNSGNLIQDSRDVTIRSGEITETGSSGVRIDSRNDDRHPHTRNVTITGCDINNNAGYGVRETGPDTESNRIEGNGFCSNGDGAVETYADSTVVTGNTYDCSGVPGGGGVPPAIDPYLRVDGGEWQETATVSIDAGQTVEFGPHPTEGGSWSWEGPGVAADTRAIEVSPTETSTYTATYTDSSGESSTQEFTVEVCSPSTLTPYVRVDGGEWRETASVSIDAGQTVEIGPHPTEGGSWAWDGPGVSSDTRELTVSPTETGTFTATHTNACGATATLDVRVTVGPAGPAAIDGTVPTDPNGDALYEDLSGDGTLNFPDVNTLFQHTDDPAVQDHVSAYDFTGDGLVDQQDVLALFEMV